ncbi:MAG: hypothetical protein R3B57_13440 [Phycisphaerales bacterium]
MAARQTIRTPDGTTYGPVGEDVLRQWAIEGRVPRESVLIAEDGGVETRAIDHPELGPILRAPPTVRGAVPPPPEGDVTGGLIPYKNGAALASYYVGIGSWAALILFPLGLVAGIIAIVLGVKGLKKHKATPAVHGVAHAWVGIICGSLVSLITLAVVTLIIVGVASGN